MSEEKPKAVCQGCGRKFTPKRRDRATYCSPDCYHRAPKQAALPPGAAPSLRKIRKRRMELGLSGTDMGELLGITRQMYSLIERGTSPLREDDGPRRGPHATVYAARVKHAKKIAKILGLPLKEILS